MNSMQKKKQYREEQLLKHIGEALRNRRLDLLITQEELALRSHFHRTYITDVESGYRNISLLSFQKLTNALKCAVSYPIIESERTMAEQNRQIRLAALAKSGGEPLLHRDEPFFMQNLINVSKVALVTSNMTKIQVAVEKFASESDGIYPRDLKELELAIAGDVPINPFRNVPEMPFLGNVESELIALKSPPQSLSVGSIEYSPIGRGANYTLRGGGADGMSLSGRVKETTYVLSGNLRNDNQP